MLKYLTAIALVVVMATPAVAHQTEVDPQVMEWKREGLARWVRQHKRELREAARRAAEPEAQATADAPVPAVYTGGPVAGIIYDIFGANGAKAVSVASCESGLDPTAQNPSGAAGLFQLMPVHWQGRFDPFDPVANTRYAFGLSNGGTDWGAWAMGVCA